jgi:hypothetical protein
MKHDNTDAEMHVLEQLITVRVPLSEQLGDIGSVAASNRTGIKGIFVT